MSLPTASSIYPSRKDPGTLLSLVSGPLLLVLGGASVLQQSLLIGVSMILVALCAMALRLRFILPCYYELTADALVIRCGMTHLALPYKGIRRVAPSDNFLWAPALSVRRLEIDSNEGLVLISPRHRHKFMNELRQRMHPPRQRRDQPNAVEASLA